MQQLPRPHWVTRGLTQPWELDERRERALVPLDVSTGEVGRSRSSRSLLREDRRRSVELEDWFNLHIETPLLSARPALLAPGPVTLDRTLTRAVALLLFSQVPRAIAGRETHDDHELTRLLGLAGADLDNIIEQFLYGMKLVRVGNSDPNLSLFYPDSGIIGFLTRDNGCVTGWAWGHAVPITPGAAVARISENADFPWLARACADTMHLQAFSVAAKGVRRAIVPPCLLDSIRAKSTSFLETRRRYVVDLNVGREARMRGLREDGTRFLPRQAFGAPDGTDRHWFVDEVPLSPASAP